MILLASSLALLAPAEAEVTIKLSGPMILGGDTREDCFLISPDSSRVVYIANQVTVTTDEIFSVPLTGGTSVKLNPTLAAGGQLDCFDVPDVFQISPDGSRVVYLADQETLNVRELYSVPTDGSSPPTKLNDTLVSGGDVFDPGQTSPDSSTVVYQADQDTDNVTELYSVPLGGGAVTKLNGTLVSGGRVLRFGFSPDSSRVVYGADQDTVGVFELYSVPLTGGAVTKLNGTLVSGGEVGFIFQISPDSSRVVYSADQDTDGVTELYSVPLTGGAVTKLNPTLISGGDVRDFGFQVSPQISPDSSRVVYSADQDTDNVTELYSVPLDGSSPPTKLNDPVFVAAIGFQISPDSSRVVYLADQDTFRLFELYSVVLDGSSPPTKLNPTLVSGGGINFRIRITPDSSEVVYLADQDTDGLPELYRVPLTGGTARKISGTLVSGRRIEPDQILISSDSSRVVYQADQDTFDVKELYTQSAQTISSDVSGNVDAGAGETVLITSDAAVAGNVAVDGGEVIIDNGSTVDGNVETMDGGMVTVGDGASVTGNIAADGATVEITGGSSVSGNVEATNGSTVTITDTTVDGNVLTENSPSVTIVNSTIQGNILSTNDGSVTITDNTVSGSLQINTPTSCTESNNNVNGNNSGCP